MRIASWIRYAFWERSRGTCCRPEAALFVAKRQDGIQTRCPRGGVVTEHDTHGYRDRRCSEHCQGGRLRGTVENVTDDHCGGQAEQNTGRASDQAQHDRLDEELAEDVPSAGTDGHAQTDLAR